MQAGDELPPMFVLVGTDYTVARDMSKHSQVII